MALDEFIEKMKEDKISRRSILKAGAAVGIGLAGASLAGCTTPTPTPSASVTPGPAGIKTIADLKGKKIALPSVGSIQDIMLRQQLQKAGMSYEKDITVQAPMAGGDMITAMSSGAIDAALMWEPFVTMAKQQGVADVLLWSEDMMPGHPCDTIATTTKFIQDYPDSLKAFLLAHQDGVEYIRSDFDDAAAIVGSGEWLNSGTVVEKEALPHMEFMTVPSESFIAGTETFATEMKNLDKLKKEHTRADIFDLSVVSRMNEPASGTPKVKDTVKVGWMPTDHHAPAFIASTKKFFDNHNIRVEFVKFTAGPQIMAQVVAGTIDIGMAGVPPVLAAIDNDPTVKIVAAVHTNGSGLFYRKGLTP
ncbi:MAG: alkanesulfonate transporter substrate-binding subunit [Methanocella sp. PtaU1.Bin125]|nr:MAG: alkanesulfonate transporter substrate-binding subunit [Methanocella sp. PtaU1.Bin125]